MAAPFEEQKKKRREMIDVSQVPLHFPIHGGAIHEGITKPLLLRALWKVSEMVLMASLSNVSGHG